MYQFLFLLCSNIPLWRRDGAKKKKNAKNVYRHDNRNSNEVSLADDGEQKRYDETARNHK